MKPNLEDLPKDVINKIARDNFKSALDLEAWAQVNFKNRRAIDMDKIFRKWEQDKMPNDRWRILSQEIAKGKTDVIFTKEGTSDIIVFQENNSKYIAFDSDQYMFYALHKKSVIETKLFNLKLITFHGFFDQMVHYHIKYIDEDQVIYKLLENGYSLNIMRNRNDDNALIISCNICSKPAIGKCCPSGAYCGKSCQSQDMEHVCKSL